MATKKITELTADTSPTSDDILPIVNDPAGTPTTKKATAANIITKAHGLGDSTVVGVSGGVMTSGTDVAVLDGGTGASNASGARTNLGLVIGTDVQAYDADLATIAGLTATTDNVIQSVGSAWASRTPAQLKATLALAKADVGLGSVDNTADSAKTVAAANALKSATTTVDTSAATAPSSGQVLTATGGSAATWQTPATAAKATFRFVVAASGGDYTTLGAALAAMSAGDAVFVKNGTYTESAITSSLSGITIMGESASNALLSMGANSITLSGANVTVMNIGLTATNGVYTFSGASPNVTGCTFAKSGSGDGIVMSGGGGLFTNNICTFTSTNTTAKQFNFSTAATLNGNTIADNSFTYNPTNTSNQTFYINAPANTTHQGAVISNNKFLWSSSGGFCMIYADTCNQLTFTGNTVRNSDTAQHCLYLSAGTWNTVIGNTFYRGAPSDASGILNISSTYTTVSGNVVVLNAGNAGIYVNATAASVTGNVVNTTTTGSFIGIYISGNANRSSVSGNAVRGSGISNTGIQAAVACPVTGNFVYNQATGINLSGTNCSCSSNVIDTCTTAVLLGANYQTVTGNNLGNFTTAVDFNTRIGCNIYNNNGADVNMEKRVVYMKNTSGGSITAGSLVTLKAVAAGNEVTTTTTASDNAVFGMAEETIASTASGYILVRGKTTLLKVDGTTDIAIGDYISTFTTAGIGQKATVGTLNTTPGHLAIAFALEAYTTNDSNGVIDAILIPPIRL